MQVLLLCQVWQGQTMLLYQKGCRHPLQNGRFKGGNGVVVWGGGWGVHWGIGVSGRVVRCWYWGQKCLIIVMTGGQGHGKGQFGMATSAPSTTKGLSPPTTTTLMASCTIVNDPPMAKDNKMLVLPTAKGPPVPPPTLAVSLALLPVEIFPHEESLFPTVMVTMATQSVWHRIIPWKCDMILYEDFLCYVGGVVGKVVVCGLWFL